MLTELTSLQKSAAQLPAHAQAGLHGLSDRVGVVATDVNNIVRSEAPVSEKLSKLREAVEQQVQPLLAGASAKVNNALNAVRGKTEETAEKANGTANGMANGSH